MSTVAPTALHERIMAATAELPDVLARDAEAQAGRQRFKYLSEAGQLPLIRQALLKHGLSLTITEASPPVRETAAPRVDKETGQVFEQHAITVHLQAIVSDGGEHELAADLYGTAIDRDGRGHASARTDALKGLRQVFALAADDDAQPAGPVVDLLDQAGDRAKQLRAAMGVLVGDPDRARDAYQTILDRSGGLPAVVADAIIDILTASTQEAAA